MAPFCPVRSTASTFPVAKATLPPQRGDHDQDLVSGNGETVLVVEYEASILQPARRLLLQLGYKAQTSSSPLLALELARTHQGKIDLLITDVAMPDMKDRELATILKTMPPVIKVLYMSGYTSNIIAKHGILDVDILLLQKPFSQKAFAAKVHQALHDGT